MKPILIAYATREGYAKRVAEHVAATIRSHGGPEEVADVASIHGDIDLGGYGAVILVASIHIGHHEPEMIAFVRKHKAALEHIRTALLSISLSEAGAEKASASAEARAKAAHAVQGMLDAFFEETHWRPARVMPIAGALLYSHYHVLLRLAMKDIARREGGDTDTSRDYEYTDWQALDRFIVGVLDEVVAGTQPTAAE